MIVTTVLDKRHPRPTLVFRCENCNHETESPASSDFTTDKVEVLHHMECGACGYKSPQDKKDTFSLRFEINQSKRGEIRFIRHDHKMSSDDIDFVCEGGLLFYRCSINKLY